MPDPLHLLLVEDSPVDTDLVLREIRRAGYEPKWHRVDTEKAFLYFLTPDIDIIISDYEMPQFNGFRALELLKKSGLKIPFLLVSGTIGEEIAVEAMKNGATDYLLKDRMARLGPAVRHSLAESRIERERELAREELRLRETALNVVSQGVLICDESRRVVYANDGFTRLTGYAREEIIGRSCAILQGRDTDASVVARMRAALDEGRSFEGEILNYRKDGTPFWNELSLSVIDWKDGSRPRFLGLQRDVTERKMAREALQRSEERVRKERSLLRALIDSIPDLIFFKSRDSRFLGCNRAFEKYTNITEEELIGLSDFDIVDAGIASKYVLKDREMFASGVAQRVEEWIPASPEGGGTFDTVKTPFFGPNGETLGVIGVSRDITERKRVEEEMRLALDRLQLATKAARAGIWEYDLNANTAVWDEQMYELFGVTKGREKDGKDRWFELMHPEGIALCEDILKKAREKELDSFDIEFCITRADDHTVRHMRSMGLVKRDGTGKALRLIGINSDVTVERMREASLATALAHEKLLAREAEAGNHAKSEFLAVMSHEIRTPMNGILGFSELLFASSQLPAECRDYVKTIASSGEALLRILDDILDFSRLEAGGLKLDPSLFSPRQVVENIHALLGPTAADKRLEFLLEIAPEVPEQLWADAGRLRQILLNLTGNAIKFTEQGSVTLGMRPAADPLPSGRAGLEFFVKDTGLGISREKLEHIFEPFAQADSSISRRYGGTGLGLPISRNLAELMGGKLSVRSLDGIGSEFWVSLPIALPENAGIDPEETTTLVLDESFASRHPHRILLVEDDKVNLKLMLMMLRKLGYEPLTARDGAEAVDVYRRERPDCVLMDLQMPKKDGLQATIEIREIERVTRQPPAFIAALTANIVAEDRQRCLEAGMDYYMNKPIKRTTLAKTLGASASTG